jgi:hypothetical protein
MSTQEQPEDQPVGDQPAADETVGDQPAADETAADQPTGDGRIEELSEHIDQARSHAEDAGVLDDPDAEEYVDSGATAPQDDQTIVPPG